MIKKRYLSTFGDQDFSSPEEKFRHLKNLKLIDSSIHS